MLLATKRHHEAQTQSALTHDSVEMDGLGDDTVADSHIVLLSLPTYLDIRQR